ncbi:MAG: hypothetical protein AAGJ79_08090 [Verrucomicrobiota bacterium]
MRSAVNKVLLGVVGMSVLVGGVVMLIKDASEERAPINPAEFRVSHNCVRFVKWHHMTTGQISHIGYALTRSPDERAVFRAFGLEDEKLVFQIDGYLEPETMNQPGTGMTDERRLRAVNYNFELLKGSDVTPERVRALLQKEDYKMYNPAAMTRQHTIYTFGGFTDEQMDRMEERERNIRAEIEAFRGEEDKRFDKLNCSVVGAIVVCEGGDTGLLRPWRVEAKLDAEFLSNYTSRKSALVDYVLMKEVARGRGWIEGDFEKKLAVAQTD